ncbi:bifunctional diguanylate cyclase/phosphodiesterase [uncultured Massilia sp.]|uniref:sensor domain-containing protein n=1 Tax=uncultured Massilia sp. TaxID=169973 RepID=UPI0025E39DC6|nr:bifunctional diguanylate cyclase/phosphodiesterase [uncultured Massilia sp.]
MAETESPIRVVFLTDEAGHILTWNTACATLFGLAPAQALGRPVTTLFSPSGRDAWHAGWAALTRNPDGAEVRVDIDCAGRMLAACLTLAPQRDAADGLRGWAVAMDTGGARDAPEAARVARTPLSSIVNMFPGTFYVVNRDGRLVLWNRNLERLTGMAPEELAAARTTDMLELDERALWEGAMRRVFDTGAEFSLELDYVSRSGRETPLLLCGARLRCDGDDYLVGMGMNIAERRAREQRLRLRERALHAASNGILITRCDDSRNVIEYVNPAFERIAGYPEADVLGRDPRIMAAPGMDTVERAQLRDAIAARQGASVVLRNLRKDGEPYWADLSITPVQDEHGAVTHYIGVITDVTAARLRTAHLEHEVNHDPLTGLANRNLLWDRLEQALHLAQRQKSLVATVLIDLDKFKAINDTHGHEAGDVVLKVVARRLQASVRDSDTVARMSGDEFVLVLANQPSLRFTLRMVERLRQSFAVPVSFNGQDIPVGASLGVAMYPHDGATAPELVRAADLAMYQGKANGRNDVHYFSADMRAGTEAKRRLQAALREALDRNELFLVYQPRIAVRSGKVSGFEALLRWRHPEQGVLPPAGFLAEAEEMGIMVQIGGQVLDQACAFAAALRASHLPDVPVAVNVSYREYSQPGFLAGLAERLARHGLPPHALQLDLQIDGLIRNPSLGRELAGQLRDMGVDLSVDGFGAGLCDLGFLQQLAARQVRLAQSAVHAIADGGAALAKSLIDIGHNLDMEVIGAAVETRPQLDFLASNGCDQVQGMWFSEPLPEDAARQMLKEHLPA